MPYEVAYRAATQAMFSIGFSISHSDKASGILTGSRTVGVTEMKKELDSDPVEDAKGRRAGLGSDHNRPPMGNHSEGGDA